MNIRFVCGTPFSKGEGPGMRQLNRITTVQVSDTTMLNSSTSAGPTKKSTVCLKIVLYAAATIAFIYGSIFYGLSVF